ncbi:MAG: hypothetical protein HUK08_09330 [Bacteroidaceae bacterium]|nr:hypothetical protein [Oscillospiraceae bacterium]MCF0203552.1 hypothetical protein [Bacteroidaceae bacterium]
MARTTDEKLAEAIARTRAEIAEKAAKMKRLREQAEMADRLRFAEDYGQTIADMGHPMPLTDITRTLYNALDWGER